MVGDALKSKLRTKNQPRPSTLKMTNSVPQLAFLGQTRPCVDVVLYVSIKIMQKVHLPLIHVLPPVW
jgi:hypothetical protein